jgi:fibronectin-binding autotransporter adhesin
MNIVKKTRLIHLGNTSLFTKETTLSPKFWAKCATVVSSLAMMEDASASSTIEVAGSTATIGTKFSGSGAFEKTGAGTLVLNYDNTSTTDPAPLAAAFTGQTTLTAGTLALQNAGALGSGGTLTMAANTTLQAYASITVPNAIVLGGNSTIDTTGNSLNNTLTLTGGITETATSVLTVAGAGTLVLNNTSTHTGGTTLGGTSTLKIGHANAIPATGTLTLGTGTTLQDSTSASINALTLDGNATVTVDASTTLTATGAVTGGFTLTKSTGTGTLVLTGTNSSGDTNLTISAGTVSVAADENIPGGALSLNGGKLLSTGTTSAKAFTMVLDSSIGSSGTLTYSGAIADADSAKTLTVSEGTVALNANYSGNTLTDLNVNSGATLSIGAANNLTGGALTLRGGTLQTTAGFTSNKNIAVNVNSTLDVTGTLTASGVISGTTTATLNKNTTAGTLVLTGVNSASATTNLTITTGTVSVAADANIPGGTLTLAGGKLLASAGYTSGKAITMAGASSIGSAAGVLTYNGTITDDVSPVNLTISNGSVALAANYSVNTNTNLTVASGATLRINEANNLTGGSLTLNGGTLKTTANFTSSKAIVLTDHSSLDVTGTLTASGVISGAKTLTKTSAGTLILAGENSSGDTNLTITTGTVSVASDANIPGGTLRLNGGKLLTGTTTSHKNFTMVDTTEIGSSGTLTYSGTITDAASPKTLDVSNGVVVLATDHNTNTNTNLRVKSYATLSIDSANRLTGGSLVLEWGRLKTTNTFGFSKNIDLIANGFLDVQDGTTLTASGTIANMWTFTKEQGTGTLVLAGTNTASLGNLTISAGTVSIDAADKLPRGVLRLNGGGILLSEATSAVTLTSPWWVIIDGNATLNIGSYDMTINKFVEGNGLLTKDGAAKLTLGVSNTHTGGITVSAGSLELKDNNAAGANTNTITLATGTTLIGNKTDGGTYANPIALANSSSTTMTASTDMIASGNITGTNANLTLNGTAPITLSGINTYSGTTTLGDSVTLNIGNSNSIGSGALLMGDGSTLVLAGGVTLPCGIQF